jgi:hypothetical protein
MRSERFPMSRALLVLDTEFNRQQAIHWVIKAPVGSRVEFKRPQRTVDQNSKMWGCLTDVAIQLPWHGIKISPDDWKLVFLDALNARKALDYASSPISTTPAL